MVANEVRVESHGSHRELLAVACPAIAHGVTSLSDVLLTTPAASKYINNAGTVALQAYINRVRGVVTVRSNPRRVQENGADQTPSVVANIECGSK